eukprot:m.976854 g.976854  ORF g.976854 m.976854 type:complete len:103 (-) comp23948_c0_seq1:3714-4022(-)
MSSSLINSFSITSKLIFSGRPGNSRSVDSTCGPPRNRQRIHLPMITVLGTRQNPMHLKLSADAKNTDRDILACIIAPMHHEEHTLIQRPTVAPTGQTASLPR